MVNKMKQEKWVEIRIKIDHIKNDKLKVLAEIIRPLLDNINHKIISFYFFYEPDENFIQCLMFRARPKEEKYAEVKREIENHMKNSKIQYKLKEDSGEYEHTKYGGYEVWQIVQKFFEYGNRLTLAKINPSIKKNVEGFNEGTLIHCFLNQWGLNTLEEACFHNRANFERHLIVFGIVQRLQKIEDEIKKLKQS